MELHSEQLPLPFGRLHKYVANPSSAVSALISPSTILLSGQSLDLANACARRDPSSALVSKRFESFKAGIKVSSQGNPPPAKTLNIYCLRSE